jgi:triphosphoribosyl-dephospho-CoA synthase
LAQLACVLEVTARKPGNVHRFQDFEDATFLDFLASAAAIAPLWDETGQRGVGETVLEGVRRTRQITRNNTNLGLLLVLAPLTAVPRQLALAKGIGQVLEELSVADARAVYKAIRLANPGGLGQAPEEDISGEPTRSLREVMTLAAARDSIARQYANDFHEVLRIGVPALRERQGPLEESIVYTQLRLMAACPDTLIARKRGLDEALESARRAQQVLALGWPDETAGQSALRDLDRWLRAEGHQRNPGTSADLVTACLFAALREGTIQVPLPQHWSSDRIG